MKNKKGDLINSLYFILFEILLIATTTVVLLKYVDNNANGTHFEQSYLAVDNSLLLSTISHVPGDVKINYRTRHFNLHNNQFNFDENKVTVTQNDLSLYNQYFSDLHYNFELDDVDQKSEINYVKKGNVITNNFEKIDNLCKKPSESQVIGIFGNYDNFITKSYLTYTSSAILEQLFISLKLTNQGLIVSQDLVKLNNEADIILIFDIDNQEDNILKLESSTTTTYMNFLNCQFLSNIELFSKKSQIFTTYPNLIGTNQNIEITKPFFKITLGTLQNEIIQTNQDLLIEQVKNALKDI